MQSEALTRERVAVIVAKEIEALKDRFYAMLKEGYIGPVLPLVTAQIQLFKFLEDANLWPTT